MTSLFRDEIDARDETYRFIRDDPDGAEAKAFVERLWSFFAPYADRSFRADIARCFPTKFWEMYLVQLVMKNYPNWLDFEDACQYLWPRHHCTAGRRALWHVAASPHYTLSYPPKSARPWNGGSGQPPLRPGWPGVGRSFSFWRRGARRPRWRRLWASNAPWCANGSSGFSPSAWMAWLTPPVAVPRALFPPEVAIHVVRLACERPDLLGRSLSQWDCAELAHQLIAEAIVEDISAATVRRILAAHQLKPWRHHLWLHPKQPRDAAFYATITALIALYTRPLRADERVLSVDEKTSLQPRPRPSPTRPAQPHNRPNCLEHEYKRAGALNLFAAFDTRSGQVYGQCYERKRQEEFITFLEQLDRELEEPIKAIHLICDNASTHHGRKVSQWLTKHPRFILHFTPVHCSWMNQVEQWFSILQRKRLRIADVDSKDPLRVKLEQFIHEWHHRAHPFNWSTKSVAKVMAKAPALAA
jgi:transposase